ncbi:MAG: glycosyltransferase, partial [Proteobacteria bacterium]|nr:glycosyltransferase [Pseudomonadota bacterium]
MRILMISDVFFPRVNGVSTSIKTFYNELTGLGHEVMLIAPEYPQEKEPYDWIHRIPSHFIPFDPEDRMMKTKCIALLFDK